jgi:2'-5' RNA ligase
VRAFVAVELTGEGRDRVQALLRKLTSTGASVRWTRDDQLHLTLKFLGPVDPSCVDSLISSLAAVAAATAPFVLTVTECGGFPSLAHPRVLWAGVSAPPLAALAQEVDAACVRHGFPAETRPFHPHVTLGRVRDGRGGIGAEARRILDTAAGGLHGRAPVDDIVLFESQLGPRGARYTPVARMPLLGAATAADG